jgi:hypothetical protein
MSDDPLQPDPADRGLAALSGSPGDVPIGDAMRAELAELAPVKIRAPRRQLVLLVAAASVYVAALLAVVGLRAFGPGLLASPGFAAAWFASFVGLTALVVVPPRGQVMPRSRLAGTLAVVMAALFVGTGLLLGSDGVTGPARALPPAGRCLTLGLLASLGPIGVTVLLVRGSLPVGRRWAAAAIGAAAGSLGGFVLEMHCPIDDRWHSGLVHGGVVVVAALLAVAVASSPVVTRRTEAGEGGA